ncbi:MAG: hypothetical protein U0350_11335 [Caldilineaceae bacterium]
MSTYPAQELLQKWALGELTAEQAIGHLLQYLQRTQQQHAELEKRVQHLEHLLSVKA